MSRELGLSVAAGLASAILFFSVLTGNGLALLTVYFAPLPLFLAGLGLGVQAVTIGGLAALTAVTLGAGAATLPMFAAVAVLPPLVLTRQALLWRSGADGQVEWYPAGLLLGWLAALAVTLVVLGAVLAPGHADGLEGFLRDYVAAGLQAMAPALTPPERQTAVSLWVPLLPAMVTGSWMLMAVANGALAQAILTRAGRNRRPTPAYRELEAPDWLAAALVLSLAVGFLADGTAGYLGRNLAVLLLVPYVFVGLAAVHGAIRSRPNAGVLLAMFYGVFFIAFGWAVIALAGLGLVRHWGTLRRRHAGGSQEEK